MLNIPTILIVYAILMQDAIKLMRIVLPQVHLPRCPTSWLTSQNVSHPQAPPHACSHFSAVALALVINCTHNIMHLCIMSSMSMADPCLHLPAPQQASTTQTSAAPPRWQTSHTHQKVSAAAVHAWHPVLVSGCCITAVLVGTLIL